MARKLRSNGAKSAVWTRIARLVKHAGAMTARLIRELQTTLDRAGIDIRVGHGSLLDANTIGIESDSAKTDLIRADYIIVATGSRPSLTAKTWDPHS
jgi:pyruvate/2-oxoglutarate dehydrogenase complex dihydrolipoamide dehydrogenase (E3) component